MSVFKKPKRNFRSREVGDNEDFENEDYRQDQSEYAVEKAEKKKKKEKSHQPVLSFHEELNEGDDGEVFQVKKSSQSKKIKKLLDKERKKKKEPRLEPGNNDEEVEKPSQKPLSEEIVIKLRNTFPILNGREAEAATVEGISSEEDESGPHHTFTKQSSNVKIMLKKGKIPDAATIHAARKQRQHVREMGDFVPVPEEKARPESSSRLMREDENDGSEGEEERITMTVNTTAEDKMRRRVEFDAAQEIETDESDKGEEEEWEAQQIRKGVTGAQLAAVQQESIYYQQYIGVGMQPAVEISNENNESVNYFPSIPSSAASIDPVELTTKMKERLEDLKQVHRRHCLDLHEAKDEINTLKSESQHLKLESPKLAEKFRYYQDLRGYVTDLVECLDEKILVIETLEQRVEALFSRRCADNVSRRRQDVIDQSQELNPIPKPSRVEKDEATVRRVAEREGRRIRRQRARELKGITNHQEGMSSDEEITEAEIAAVRAQREVIEQDTKQVFEDTLDEFGTIRGILQRFETWRETDMEAYSEAYINLCLPKLLGPLLRLKLLFWNPLVQGNNEWEKAPWCNTILLYGAKNTETEEELHSDPDLLLLPRIVDKVVIPKLNQVVSTCWDPLSSSQTVTLVGMISRLIQDYPALTHTSKPLKTLLATITEKMKDSIENDIFIPIYPKQRMSDGKVMNFFSRQCTVAVKLLGNLVCWQGLLSDDVLSLIALESLLNRYLLSAIRTTQPLQAVNICSMIGSVLPRVWLQSASRPASLTHFLNQAKLISQELSSDKPQEREALERLNANLLRAL